MLQHLPLSQRVICEAHRIFTCRGIWIWQSSWRISVHKARSTVFADLGHGVPDTAMVEAAAYCPGVMERDGTA
jgi:hypothetical protein